MAKLLWLLFLAPSLIAADFKPDFGFYPQDSQDCLNQAATTSNCHGEDSTELNACLCSNGGDFITNAAVCIGRNDKKDVEKVYQTMADACGHTQTGMTVSQKQFQDAANGEVISSTTSSSATATASSTSSSTATSTSTDTPAKSDNDKKPGLSSGATIGIAVGASMAGVAFIARIAFYIIRRRRSSRAEESHPMLSSPYQNSPGFSEAKTGWDSKHSSTSPYSPPYGRESQNYTPQSFGRESHNYTPQSFNRDSTAYAPSSLHTSPELGQGQYVGAFAPPHNVAELPPVAERNEAVYEMDASNVSEQTRLAEAPGSSSYR